MTSALEFRDLSQVKDELALIMKHKPRIIKFVDRTFNAKKSHSLAVWEHIIDILPDAGTRFHFEVHPALLDEEDFRLLKEEPARTFPVRNRHSVDMRRGTPGCSPQRRMGNY